MNKFYYHDPLTNEYIFCQTDGHVAAMNVYPSVHALLADHPGTHEVTSEEAVRRLS